MDPTPQNLARPDFYHNLTLEFSWDDRRVPYDKTTLALIDRALVAHPELYSSIQVLRINNVTDEVRHAQSHDAIARIIQAATSMKHLILSQCQASFPLLTELDLTAHHLDLLELREQAYSEEELYKLLESFGGVKALKVFDSDLDTTWEESFDGEPPEVALTSLIIGAPQAWTSVDIEPLLAHSTSSLQSLTLRSWFGRIDLSQFTSLNHLAMTRGGVDDIDSSEGEIDSPVNAIKHLQQMLKSASKCPSLTSFEVQFGSQRAEARTLYKLSIKKRLLFSLPPSLTKLNILYAYQSPQVVAEFVRSSTCPKLKEIIYDPMELNWEEDAEKEKLEAACKEAGVELIYQPRVPLCDDEEEEA